MSTTIQRFNAVAFHSKVICQRYTAEEGAIPNVIIHVSGYCLGSLRNY